MKLTIELTPEIESRLSALAVAKGVDLAEIVEGLLEDYMLTTGVSRHVVERIVTLWREPVPGRPTAPELSDEAISRESIYEARG